MVAVAIAAVSLDVRSGALVFVTGVPGALIVLGLGVALVLGRPGWIGAVLGLLVVLHVEHLLLAPEANLGTAGFVGVAVLLVGELSQWSFDSRLAGRYESSMHRTRAFAVGGLALLGAGVILLSQLAVSLPVSGGLVTLVVGVAAFVAIVALVSIVALRPDDRGTGKPA